jgi:hypothetical protein
MWQRHAPEHIVELVSPSDEGLRRDVPGCRRQTLISARPQFAVLRCEPNTSPQAMKETGGPHRRNIRAYDTAREPSPRACAKVSTGMPMRLN